MATTSMPQSRGPLAHIIDALRLDNRQLLLETLQYDPRFGGSAQHASPSRARDSGCGGADSAAGFSGDGAGDGTSETAAFSSTVEQKLVFGSADLRKTFYYQVMNHNRPKKDKKGGNKKSKNMAQAEEEEEIMKDWNEDLQKVSGGGTATQIIETRVLSPAGDGSVIGPARPSNPFSDNEADDVIDRATVTSYLLRGGGFDLSSLSSAALHRRRMLAFQADRRHDLRRRSQLKNQPHGNNGPCGPEMLFRFIFVPRMTEMERSFLSELGVKDDVSCNPFSFGHVGGGSMNSLESLPIDLIPLDDDVLSLELNGGSGGRFSLVASPSSSSTGNNFPRNAHNIASASPLESDKSERGSSAVAPPASAASMRHSDIEGCEADVADIVARSLMKLQLLNQSVDDRSSSPSSLKGAIGRVQGLGPLATAVIDRMMTLRLEEERLTAMANEEEGETDREDEVDLQQTDSNEEMDQDEVVNTTVDEVEITAHNKDLYGIRLRQQGQQGNFEDSDNLLKDEPFIQALMVIDRKIDLVTPMLTPLTYEGLIDDVLQIQVGGVSVKKCIVEPDDDGGERAAHSSMRPSSSSGSQHHNPTVHVQLNDSDPLYTEVRDRHVETFGTFLQNQAKALKESHSQFTNRETARDLTEIHRFVKQIPVFSRNLRSLTNHIHVAELVKAAAEATDFRQRWQTERSMLESEPCYEILDELLACGEPPFRWLRLFCLQSLTSNGIKATRYDSLRREVVQTYGYEFLIVLHALEKAGFLRKRETFFMDSMQTPYSVLRKSLSLINADVDPSDPEDVAYVSSGYAPMTVRWVQAAMGGYAGMDEALRELPIVGRMGTGSGGQLIDVEQRSQAESLVEALKRERGPTLGALANKWAEESRQYGSSSDGTPTKDKPVLLVYFVGGITFMELAAFRFLSRRKSFPYSIICCTTEIVNGGTLLRSLSC